MPSSEPQRLLVDADGVRYFLVPTGQVLPPGDTRVVTIMGESLSLDGDSLAPFKIEEAALRVYLAGNIKQAMAEAVAEIERIKPGHGVFHTSEVMGRLSDHQQSIEKGRTTAPDGRHLADAVRVVSAAIASGDVDAMHQAQDHLRRYGLELGDTLDDLASSLRATGQLDCNLVVNAAGVGLTGLSEALSGDPAALGDRLDDLAELLDHELGGFATTERETSAARRKQEYRESANSAIADALRAAGITPLASVARPEDG